MALKAIIFDVDGTIAETADVKRAAFNQAFAEIGLDWVWNRAVFARILADALPGSEVEFHAILHRPQDYDWLEANGQLSRLPVRARQIYRDLLESGAAPLRPGVARLMGEIIAARVPLALCSTGPREEFETLLYNRFGHEMLDALACSVATEDLNSHAPLKAYRTCLQRLGLPAHDVLAIDDNPRSVAAAASLGLCVIATPGSYGRNAAFAGACRVLSDLGQPSAPFRCLAGDAGGHSHVTLALLEQWHRQARLQRASAA